MQTNYIESIKKSIVDAQDKAQKELLTFAQKGDTKMVTSVASQIEQMSKLVSSLGITPKANIKSVKTTKKKTTKKETPITSDKAQILPLTENFTNMRPIGVSIMGEKHMVNSFRHLSEQVCRTLQSKDQTKFSALISNPAVNGDRHSYFSRTGEGMNDPVMIGSVPEAVYVDVAKLAINNMFFLKKAVEAMDVKPEKIKVTIDPNYQRKPRTKK